MTKSEVKLLLDRVSSIYPSFQADPFKVTLWYEILKPYDAIEVNQKLENHFVNEKDKNYNPNPKYLVKFLIPLKQKQERKASFINVICPYCKKHLNYLGYSEHIHKHNSIFFMKKYQNIVKIDIEEKRLNLMGTEDFEKLYDKYLQVLHNRLQQIDPLTGYLLQIKNNLDNYFQKEGEAV